MVVLRFYHELSVGYVAIPRTFSPASNVIGCTLQYTIILRCDDGSADHGTLFVDLEVLNMNLGSGIGKYISTVRYVRAGVVRVN